MLSYRVIADLAAEAGFDFCAVVLPEAVSDTSAIRALIQAGYLADMAWFERSLEKRADVRRWMPDVRAIITVGVSFFCENPPKEIWEDPSRARVARYAWGLDYHQTISAGLVKLAEHLQRLAGPNLRWRACVDSSPIFERRYAAAGRTGFITKNTMFVHSRYGACVLLGELLVSEPVEPSPSPPAQPTDPCGFCRACLTNCPTGALVADYTLDARRCIAYLTVENRSAIPIEFRARMRRWIFGCDECLQPCPFVHKLSQPDRLKRWRFDPDISAPALRDALRWSEADFLERYAGTPVERIGRRRFLRNALVAAGNSGEKSLADLLAVHAASADALLRDHAEWALARLAQAPMPP
jgi:epoxyqueuosine reductase